MWNCMVYWKPGYRQPVRLGPCRPGEDAQGAIPMGWCCRCGGEVFGAGELCVHCKAQKWKGGIGDEYL